MRSWVSWLIYYERSKLCEEAERLLYLIAVEVQKYDKKITLYLSKFTS